MWQRFVTSKGSNFPTQLTSSREQAIQSLSNSLTCVFSLGEVLAAFQGPKASLYTFVNPYGQPIGQST